MASVGKFGHLLALYFLAFFLCLSYSPSANGETDTAEEKWKKKDVRDYTDADLERLYEQWEEDDDPLEEDELPEWKRPQPKIDLSQIDPSNPEAMLHMTKKDRTLMMFATVSGDPEESETEEITRLWQSSLFNANYETQRYVVASNRVLFMLKDGAKAWEIKDFLTNQERCVSVTIEGQDYPGKGSPENEAPPQQDNNTKKKPKKPSEKPAEKKPSENDIKKTEL